MSKGIPAPRLAALIGLIAASAGIALGSQYLQFSHGLFLHSNLEAVSAAIALAIALTAFAHFYATRDTALLMLGCGFLGASALDTLHFIESSVWKVVTLTPEVVSAMGFSWLSSRLALGMLSIGCAMAFAHVSARKATRKTEYLVYAASLVAFLASAITVAVGNLPETYQSGSLVHRPFELAISPLFVAASVILFRTNGWKTSQLQFWVLVSFTLGSIVHICFMPFSQLVFDGPYVAAHVAKLLSYGAALAGVAASIFGAYRTEAKVSNDLNMAVSALETEIVSRRNAEELLKSRESALQAVFEAAVDAMLVIDARGTILSLNHSAEKLFGFSSVEAVGRNVTILMPRDIAGKHDGYLRNYFESGKKTVVGIARETWGQRADGSVFPIELSVNELTLPEGRGFVGIIRDITQRKQNEEAIRQHESRIRQILEALPIGVFVLDAKGKPFFANQHAIRLIGKGIDPSIQPDELSAEYKVFISGTNELYPTDQNPIVQALQGKTTSVGNMEVERPEGRILLQVTGTPVLDSNNSLELALAAFTDITLVKETETRLERFIDELERSNAELDQFAYMVSHDLRAPLRGISNLAEWIEEDMGEIENEEVGRNLQLLRNRVARLDTLIAGVLEFARVGRRAANPKPIATKMLVAETIDLLGPKPNERIEVAGNLPEVTADPMLLSQVFANLVGNALKYAKRGDPLVTVACTDRGIHWEFSVEDNGPGVPTAYQEKIFDLFQTIDGPKADSSGVGLAIVKKIVTNAGGRVWVEPGRTTGAKFCFTWPKTTQTGLEANHGTI